MNIANAKDVMIGTWAWGTGYNGSSMIFGSKQDENVLRDTFNEAVNRGFLKWDTAAVYGMGSCERLLGSLIKGKEIFISTKYFPAKKYKGGAPWKNLCRSVLDPCAKQSGRESYGSGPSDKGRKD